MTCDIENEMLSLNHLHRNNIVITDIIILSTMKIRRGKGWKYEIRWNSRPRYSLIIEFASRSKTIQIFRRIQRGEEIDRSIDRASWNSAMREIVENVDSFFSPAIFIAPINSKSVHQIDVSEPKIVVDKLVPPYFLSSYRRRCVLDERKDNTIYLRVVIYSRGTGESIARRGLLYNRLENHHPNFSGNRV